MEYAEEVTINYINYRALSEVTVIILQTHEFWVFFFFNNFINVFAKNYVVINCLNELIRFIVYNSNNIHPCTL